MIKRDAKLKIKKLPLSKLRVTEHQERHPGRLNHYLVLLAKNKEDYLGLISVKKRLHGKSGYEILDGHHRYLAYVMSGREDALCLIIDEEGCDVDRTNAG